MVGRISDQQKSDEALQRAAAHGGIGGLVLGEPPPLSLRRFPFCAQRFRVRLLVSGIGGAELARHGADLDQPLDPLRVLRRVERDH
jgi:hypothetical protein